MPPSWINVDRRLVMRYYNARTFSFNKVRVDAPDQGSHELAMALSSIQERTPTKITTVLTRQLF